MSRTIEITAHDVTPQGGVFCPSSTAGMELWNSHPRVYLDLADAPEHTVTCPYCGTQYRLKKGEKLSHGH